jgi:propanol-preferring alcohol dehydrogenase
VPHRRHVVPLRSLDAIAATPLGCAALSAYAAVKRVKPHLTGHARALVIGAGGLGHYAIQLLRLYGADVLAVDPRPERRERALELGAARALDPEAAAGEVADVDAVLDFVGTDESLALAVKAVGRRGIVAVLGLAGGSTPFGFYATAPEATLTTVWAGTIADLHEVVELAEAGRISAEVRTYPLEAVDDALDDLRAGRIPDRAAVVP